ncbi:winged helix-turn-helix domain-containing protein [Oscillatoria laete-virens NRMC-F 0139]|nr:winged helix-turn-helix domain-containing protein [Oscillatoria laete-virens]MDL5052960.1 winged helix-turn-helix domain-containing protein [Oscillatoria laete-virens NRMC-F 0139]
MRQNAADIERVIRDEIVSGHYPPGAKLPTQWELMNRFQSSRGTIHKVLTNLAADGFVKSRKKGGTQVLPEPPFLNVVGMVFPCRPEEGIWSPYWHLLRQFAERNDHPSLRLRILFAGHGQKTHPDFQALEDEIVHHRLAGLIFASMPVMLAATSVLATDHLIRVAVMDAPHFMGQTTGVWFDYDSYLDEVVAWMRARKTRRLAVIHSCEGALGEWQQPDFAGRLRRAGIRLEKKWVQSVSKNCLQTVPHLVALLFSEKQNEMPDTLFIADDTIRAAVLDGLGELPRSTRTKIKVLAHANFPVSDPIRKGISLIGFNIGKLFDTLLSCYCDRRQNASLSTLRLIAPEIQNS